MKEEKFCILKEVDPVNSGSLENSLKAKTTQNVLTWKTVGARQEARKVQIQKGLATDFSAA